MSYSLQQLSDRLEIQDLNHAYAAAIDQKDFDRLNEVFTPDAHIDYSAMGGEKGDYPAIKAFLSSTLPGLVDYYHLVGNLQIELRGDTATGRVMCFNPMGIPVPGKPAHMMFLGLFYLDEYRRTPAGWRISRRVEERCWGHNVPAGIDTGS
jgi:ketosteroid isomerase-like protein